MVASHEYASSSKNSLSSWYKGPDQNFSSTQKLVDPLLDFKCIKLDDYYALHLAIIGVNTIGMLHLMVCVPW